MTDHPTLVHEMVDLARRNEKPNVICRMRSGWAVLGDHQFITGYSLLLPDPVVTNLTDLDDAARSVFLTDMAVLGEALHACTDTFRINYEILGNGEAALHAHVFPRYLDEPDRFRRMPVWEYGLEQLATVAFDPATHGDLQKNIASYIAHRPGL